MWPIMRFLNKSPIAEEEMDFSGWMKKRKVSVDGVPIHVLYSKHDGIVSPSSAMLEYHPDVSYTHVSSSHIGFAFNKVVYNAIIERVKLILDAVNTPNM